MFRTVSIATLMGLSAGGTHYAGYSAPDMAEIIFANAGDHDQGRAVSTYGRPSDRRDSAPVPFA